MISPDLSKLLKTENGELSRYSLVAAVSKRAREIVDQANESHEIISDKPISLAVEELLDGEYRIVENRSALDE